MLPQTLASVCSVLHALKRKECGVWLTRVLRAACALAPTDPNGPAAVAANLIQGTELSSCTARGCLLQLYNVHTAHGMGTDRAVIALGWAATVSGTQPVFGI